MTLAANFVFPSVQSLLISLFIDGTCCKFYAFSSVQSLLITLFIDDTGLVQVLCLSLSVYSLCYLQRRYQRCAYVRGREKCYFPARNAVQFLHQGGTALHVREDGYFYS